MWLSYQNGFLKDFLIDLYRYSKYQWNIGQFDISPTPTRSVPFILKEKIEEELDHLVSEVIEPVKSSKWAAPIVPVVKQDGKIRICGDYKLTANPVSKLNAYLLPKIEELFTALAGGKMLSKLDLSHAYLQLPLEEALKPLTTINTHKGLFQ